jgi:hypothetical protein
MRPSPGDKDGFSSRCQGAFGHDESGARIRPSGSTGAHGTGAHAAALPPARAAGTPGILAAAESGLLPLAYGGTGQP